MAILTVSRQVASLGDEICAALANKIGYRFICRRDIEKRIVELGFPAEKIAKYDERKPGFFASLAKDRDEYLDCLQTAILEAASDNNCILIGRGASIILKSLPNHISCRFISEDSIRIKRLMAEKNWDEKAALKRVAESDANRAGFYKSFFNFDIKDYSQFHLVLNSGLLDIDAITEIIAQGLSRLITEEKEYVGMKLLDELLICQRIVNMLVFDYRLNINFLRTSIDGDRIMLHGVAESAAVVERALIIASCELPQYKIESAINVVQDFKAYPQ